MATEKLTQILIRSVYFMILMIITIVIWLIFRSKPLKVEHSVIQRQDFVEKYFVDGKIRSKNKQTVVAFAAGDIEQINFKSGDLIRKGQLITTLHWDYTIKVSSPIDGVVVKVYRQSAGPIARGEPLVDVVDPGDVEIVAEILTSDAIRIPVGAKVEVSGVGDSVYEAKVVNISRGGFIKTSALGVEEERTEVRMNFVGGSPDLFKSFGDNYHVELAIILSMESSAVTVPLGALFKIGDRWAVYVIENHQAKVKAIQISKKNDREAVVLNGLEVGQKVILFPSDNVNEGMKIQE